MIFLRREEKFVLDSSSIIDERIVHLFEKKFFEGKILIPVIVRSIVKKLGDNNERLIQTLKRNAAVEFVSDKGDGLVEGICVLKAAQKRKAKVITVSDELCRLAKFYPQVWVIDIRDLYRTLMPVFTPSRIISVRVVKRGLHQHEGVGYIEGVKVIIENGAKFINQTVNARVSTMIISDTGNLVFCTSENRPAESPSDNRIPGNSTIEEKPHGIPR